MVKPLTLAAMLTIAAGSTSAQSAFDGRWAGPFSSCANDNPDSPPIQILDGYIHFYENSCALTNPVDIQGMDGQLFDVVCSVANETWSDRGLLLLNVDGTLTFSRGGLTRSYTRCE